MKLQKCINKFHLNSRLKISLVLTLNGLFYILWHIRYILILQRNVRKGYNCQPWSLVQRLGTLPQKQPMLHTRKLLNFEQWAGKLFLQYFVVLLLSWVVQRIQVPEINQVSMHMHKYVEFHLKINIVLHLHITLNIGLSSMKRRIWWTVQGRSEW